MIDRERFELIKSKYGHYASWAVWANEGIKPKDNTGDLSVLDTEHNINLLPQLKPTRILVGLNISRRIEAPLANFHDARPQAMDYKIRYALRGSPFWGSYMTDVIKDFEQKISGRMMNYLSRNKAFEEENIRLFVEELNDLGSTRPIIVAFGRDAHTILHKHFGNSFTIYRIPHYSNYSAKEKYREEVSAILDYE